MSYEVRDLVCKIRKHRMREFTEKSIRILTFRQKNKDWTMWSDKFITKASMNGYDVILDGMIMITEDDDTSLSTNQDEAQEEAQKLNKKA